MIRTVLFLRPVNGDCAAIERYFDEERVLDRAARVPGFVAAELQLPAEPTDPALVTALWSSREAYRAWVEDPWREDSAGRASAVFTPIERPEGGGSIYEVAIAVGRSTSGEGPEQ